MEETADHNFSATLCPLVFSTFLYAVSVYSFAVCSQEHWIGYGTHIHIRNAQMPKVIHQIRMKFEKWYRTKRIIFWLKVIALTTKNTTHKHARPPIIHLCSLQFFFSLLASDTFGLLVRLCCACFVFHAASVYATSNRFLRQRLARALDIQNTNHLSHRARRMEQT